MLSSVLSEPAYRVVGNHDGAFVKFISDHPGSLLLKRLGRHVVVPIRVAGSPRLYHWVAQIGERELGDVHPTLIQVRRHVPPSRVTGADQDTWGLRLHKPLHRPSRLPWLVQQHVPAPLRLRLPVLRPLIARTLDHPFDPRRPLVVDGVRSPDRDLQVLVSRLLPYRHPLLLTVLVVRDPDYRVVRRGEDSGPLLEDRKSVV